MNPKALECEVLGLVDVQGSIPSITGALESRIGGLDVLDPPGSRGSFRELRSRMAYNRGPHDHIDKQDLYIARYCKRPSTAITRTLDFYIGNQ